MKLAFFKTTSATVFLVAVAAASAQAADFTNLYRAGHADLAVGYGVTEGLHLFYELSSTAVVNGSPVGGGASASPSDLSVIVPESVLTIGHTSLPAPFAGNALYVLAQTSAGAGTRPFLGFGAEEIDPGVFVGDALTFTLTDFFSSTGGQFVLFSNGSQANPSINTADGLSASDFVDLYAGGHDHFNLGFTAAGIYDLTFSAAGVLVGGGSATASGVFRFVVGDAPVTPTVPEPGSLMMAGLAMTAGGLVAARRRRAHRLS
ncbi:choice-of-anchor M domain-containing protein [Planctomyces sp. SH-PL62]|uniref:choice-of-anchor M domain-containing protein n=1 Tax=Planctomyces sp. SH-PL62 TaxID=1636152 RepID=UPI00078B9485|nr:choice-of-anchor M domain-containing protein [Planctomyces sp. SH-PL62]AMV39252.1 hypothetical protein VT85_17575 [Planctomyces sp. SH-PL62]